MIFTRTLRLYVSASHTKVPVDTGNPLPKNTCINCKHFKPAFLTPNRFGTCKKFGTFNLVDGSIEYPYASIAREYNCKGEHFDDIYSSDESKKIKDEHNDGHENDSITKIKKDNYKSSFYSQNINKDMGDSRRIF